MDAPVHSHARILALYAAAALASSLKDQAGLILAQSNLNNYRSRGHGKENTMSVSFASNTNRQTRSKYLPHVGAKEIARHNRTLDFYGVRQLCHRDKTLLDNARRLAKRMARYGVQHV
jgi:hypothetical protein